MQDGSDFAIGEVEWVGSFGHTSTKIKWDKLWNLEKKFDTIYFVRLSNIMQE